MGSAEYLTPDGTASGRRPVAVGSLTHVGMIRPSNQDAYHARVAPDAPDGANALLAVADGMGGHKAGEVASAIAIEGIVSGLSGNLSERGAVESNRQEQLLKEVVQEVNWEVHEAARSPERLGMGTTLTVVLLVGSRLLVAHVGDSRAYLLRNTDLLQITTDHTWVNAEIARGVLTEEQAQEHPWRNVLTRAIGTAPHVEVDGTAVDVEDGDTLLLSSDGLHSVVGEETIRETLAGDEPQKVCETLVEQANALGGPDNVTVVVARLGELVAR